ncbi:single-stranded DNA-binding protein (plasmid) [Deinococcus sp. KNUC1210]|uniref:single-stranded DNA-binding protein n=1 Tax=Deinococcus sp. KNUC1210 TaxID=2917691 RepID=UPI001EF0FD4F|nr:single-stranded DNA-binding protein [Deinococcus sp. KNUC1210]ULH17416.1 single-stranded DNA-binding protein [Deinococcus sp. KNUC1210]
MSALTLHLTGVLGTSITVNLTDERDVLPTLRKYGHQGWTSGNIPAGGLVLPLAMADDFDWALIGARPYTNADGEACVLYRGHSYKRREMDEVDTKKLKLPKIVKYSRGAKPTDPAHLKEGEDGGVQYVTLISFKGAGRVIEAYLNPDNRTSQPEQQASQEVPDVLRKDLVHRLNAVLKIKRLSMADVLREQGVQQLVQVDDLALAQIVARLEQA